MEIKSNVPTDYESMGVIKDEALILQALEDKLGIPFFRDPFYRFVNNVEFNNFAIGATEHVIGLRLHSNYDSHGSLGSFPEEIFSLTSLKVLDICNQDISYIPARIKELTNLNRLDLYLNPISEIPPEVMELKNLETFYLTGKDDIIPQINVMLPIRSLKIKGNLEIEKLRRAIEEYSDKVREEQKNLRKKAKKLLNKHGGNYNAIKIVYPPNYNELIKNGHYEYMVLFMLKKNQILSSRTLESVPLKFHPSYLSVNLLRLCEAELIFDLGRYYVISRSGRKRLKELTKKVKKKIST